MLTTLVTVSELARHIRDPAWKVFDCRFQLADPEAGRRAYDESRIPTAIHADIERHLSAAPIPGVTGRHPLPERNEWIDRMRGWGIGPGIQVVAYDDAGGMFAARMWWMLRWAGHAAAAVLDGGWQAWIAEGTGVARGPVPASGHPYPEPSSERAPLTRLVEAGDIDAAAQVLLDARDAARFRGEREPIDLVAGHIPGARCAAAAGNLDGNGFFHRRAALRRRFEALIDQRESRDVVCYCGSGITAAHNILAMRHAGFDEPLLYAGSWSEWITDPKRGVATGE